MEGSVTVAGSEDSRRSKAPRKASGGTGSASPRRSGSHDQRQRESREQQWIYLGAAAIFALVLVIVAAGVILTWYLPPRAHVLTVGDREFNASEVADFALYLATAGNGEAQRAPAQEGISALTKQEVLLQVGPTVVEPVTDAEVHDAIATRLGMTEGDFTELQFGEALGEYLRVSGLDRATLEDIVRAGLYESRVTAMLKEDLPESGDQFHVVAIRTNDRAKAQAVADAVRAGADFKEAATEQNVLEDNGDVLDLGWFAPSAVGDRLHDVLADLQEGDVSDPVNDANNVGFEVFFVDERTVDEPYKENILDQLSRLALDRFVNNEEGTVKVTEDLSDSERDWIQRRVVNALIAASGG
jgi:parvulin-like peptidyl-prolyl isomerase